MSIAEAIAVVDGEPSNCQHPQEGNCLLFILWRLRISIKNIRIYVGIFNIRWEKAANNRMIISFT